MSGAMRKPWAGALAMLAALALPALASAGAQPAGNVRLSDGRTFAHWAHPEERALVRQRPSQSSRRVARTSSPRMGSPRSTRSCGASPIVTGAPGCGSASRCVQTGARDGSETPPWAP